MPKIQNVVKQTPSDKVSFALVSSETVRFPREEGLAFAKAHAEMPSSPTERTLDESRVCELIVRIQEKVFLPCQWATVTYQGKKCRMNGQHSARAIVEAKDALPPSLTFHIDHYETADAIGMGMLFRQFDARMSGRSKVEVAGAYKGLIPDLAGVPREKVKLGVEGVAWYERQIEGVPIGSGDDLYAMVLKPAYHSFLRWLDKIIDLKTPELKRATVMSAAYGTFIKSESGAQEFWSAVAQPMHLNDDGDPRSMLSAELLKQREASVSKSKSGKPLKPAEFYAKCVKAWNCFRDGTKPSSLNVNIDKGLPAIAA